MRTITELQQRRLVAQSSEAEFQGLEKVAAHLDNQLINTDTRETEEPYSYSHDELVDDVETLMWTAALRAQDYYGKTADAREVADIVEAFANDFVDSLRTKIGAGPVGPYEPFVPGEVRKIVQIDEDGDDE